MMPLIRIILIFLIYAAKLKHVYCTIYTVQKIEIALFWFKIVFFFNSYNNIENNKDYFKPVQHLLRTKAFREIFKCDPFFIPKGYLMINWLTESHFHSLPDVKLIGGVSAWRTEEFERVNGWSNLFWFWGGEDDDMSYRYHTWVLQNHCNLFDSKCNPCQIRC